MMVTVEGRTFLRFSATPATVEELLILELTEPREEELEEMLFDAAMPPRRLRQRRPTDEGCGAELR